MWKIDDETNIFSELFFLRYLSPVGFEVDKKINAATEKLNPLNLDKMS